MSAFYPNVTGSGMTMPRMPDITPLRDASLGFGLWPWAEGPLWRLEKPWSFFVVVPGAVGGRGPLPFTIPAGYEFDKASVPSFFWGFPFNYTPDGLCTVPALEHDFLCDLYGGGSPWLRERLGRQQRDPGHGLMLAPPALRAEVIHRHFYEGLLRWGVRRAKARAMWGAVRVFGPGGLFAVLSA